MKFHKRSFKLRRISKNEDSSREKSNQMRKIRKRKKKDTFHQPKKKCVQSRQEKWKYIRKDKRVSRRNTNSSRLDGSLSNWKKKKNAVEWKPIKFQKKISKKRKEKRSSLG